MVCFPHSFDKVNKIKFKPNENVLFTCGNDSCFKSWILQKNRPIGKNLKRLLFFCLSSFFYNDFIKVTNDPNEETFNWVYNTCNGFRDMRPTDLDFTTLNSTFDLIAVSFGHVVTLWLIEAGGLSFVSDLIHCDPEDPVSHLKFAGNYLLAAHKFSLNLWNLMPFNLNNNNSNQFELESLINKIRPMCLWSESFNEVLSISANPIDATKLILISQKANKKINDEITTEIKSKSNKKKPNLIKPIFSIKEKF